jgi:hypothetical protein
MAISARIGRKSKLALARIKSRTAPGLAAARRYRANHQWYRSSPATLGQARSMP